MKAEEIDVHGNREEGDRARDTTVDNTFISQEVDIFQGILETREKDTQTRNISKESTHTHSVHIGRSIQVRLRKDERIQSTKTEKRMHTVS